MSLLPFRAHYEDVQGYSPISIIKQKAFLTAMERDSIWKFKRIAAVYVGYRLSFLAVIVLGLFFHVPISLLMLVAFTIPLFSAIVDRELSQLADRKLAFESGNYVLGKLATAQANGWYADPWANGIVGQQRKWEDGKWSKDIKIIPQ